MSACCGTCIYWGKDEKLGPNVGMCRRYPPNAVVVPAQTTQSGVAVQSHFPPTLDYGWCGEFSERPMEAAN